MYIIYKLCLIEILVQAAYVHHTCWHLQAELVLVVCCLFVFIPEAPAPVS